MEKLVAGQEVEVPGFIVVSEYGRPTHCTQEMTNHGFITIMPHTLKFTVPVEFNAVSAEVAAIEKKLDTMADDYHKKVRNLKERIESLLCLEMSPAAEVPGPQTPMSSDIDDDDFPF